MDDRGDRATARRFVGRLAELEALEHALPHPGDGVRLVLVAGEAGIGKTRLVREFCRPARPSVRTVHWAHCWDAAAAPSFWPWAHLVRQVLGRTRGVSLASLLSVRHDLEVAQLALFDATARVLSDAARRHPLVLVLDDLHCADPASLLLLRYLLACGVSEPILVIGTLRDGAAHGQPEVAEQLAALTRTATVLRLGGLSPEHARLLLGPARFTQELYDVSSGNPLHLQQALHAPVADGGPGADRRALRDVVAARLADLTPDVRAMLVATAVLGPRASAASIDELLAGSVPDLAATVASARRAGLIDTDEGRQRLRPVHPLLAELALVQHPPAELQLLHERAAGPTASNGVTHAERAHHLLRAGDRHRPEAVVACVAAARESGAATDHEGAVRHYRQALAALIGLPADPRLEFELLLGLAEVEERAFGTRAASRTRTAAVAQARRLGDPTLVARALVGEDIAYYLDTTVAVERLDLCEQALAALPEGDSIERARLLAHLATGALAGLDTELNRARAEAAVAMARRLGEPATLGIALVAEQVADLGPASLRGRTTSAREILRLAEGADRPTLAIHGRFLLKAALLEDGDIRELDAQLTAQQEQVIALGEGRFRRHWLWFTCMRSMLDGNAAEVERLAAECGGLADELQDPDGVGVYFGQLGVARWLQGRLPEMEEAYLDRMRAEPTEPLWPAVLAWVALHDGRLDAARGHAAHFVDPADVPSSQHTLLTWFTMADVAAALDDLPLMRALYDVLSPYADRTVPIAMGAGCFGIVARALGGLAHRLGRPDEAGRHYERALDRAGRLSARPFLVDAQLALAELLLEQTDQHPRAAALVQEAEQVVLEHRMEVFAPRLAALRETLAPTFTPSHRSADLTPDLSTDPPTDPATAQVRVLGTFEVTGLDGRPAQWTSRRARVLLKILAAHRGAPVSREWLLSELWPGTSPVRLGNRLAVALTVARRALDPGRTLRPNELIVVERATVRLVLDRVRIDAVEFLARAEAIDAGRDEREAVAAALGLWHGEALPDEPEAAWAEALRSDVRFAALTLLRRSVALAQQAGDPLETAEAARRVLAVRRVRRVGTSGPRRRARRAGGPWPGRGVLAGLRRRDGRPGPAGPTRPPASRLTHRFLSSAPLRSVVPSTLQQGARYMQSTPGPRRPDTQPRAAVAAAAAILAGGALIGIPSAGAQAAARSPITDRVSVATGGVHPGDGGNVGRRGTERRLLSNDGRFVVFEGAAPFAKDQAAGDRQIVLRDRKLGTTRVVSRSSSGALANKTAAILRSAGMVAGSASSPRPATSLRGTATERRTCSSTTPGRGRRR